MRRKDLRWEDRITCGRRTDIPEVDANPWARAEGADDFRNCVHHRRDPSGASPWQQNKQNGCQMRFKALDYFFLFVLVDFLNNSIFG